MASPTFEQLVLELGARIDGAFLGTLTATSSNGTTLTIADMLKFLPNSINTGLNWWIYAGSLADTLNLGQEARATAWANSSGVMTLYAPGFSGINPTTGKIYEIHPRVRRARKAAAINAAVGELGLYYWRDFVDESITTVVATDGATVGTNGWKYNLTSLIPTLNIQRIKAIEIQIGTSTLMVSAGFPYVDATPWNYRTYKTTNVTTGAETWWLQFEVQPPPGRILRISGEAYLSQLALDTDTLPVSGQWGQAAQEWLYDWASYLIARSYVGRINNSDASRSRQEEFDRLQTAKENLLLAAPTHDQIQIITPGRGDGRYSPGLRNDPSWLSAFRSIH